MLFQKEKEDKNIDKRNDNQRHRIITLHHDSLYDLVCIQCKIENTKPLCLHRDNEKQQKLHIRESSCQR